MVYLCGCIALILHAITQDSEDAWLRHSDRELIWRVTWQMDYATWTLSCCLIMATVASAATPLGFEPIAVIPFTQVRCAMEPPVSAHLWGRGPLGTVHSFHIRELHMCRVTTWRIWPAHKQES